MELAPERERNYPAPKNYTETVTDLRQLIREEQDAERRQKLRENIDQIDSDYSKMREQVTNLRILAASQLSGDAVRKIAADAAGVLTERVDNLVWMVRGIIVAVALEVIGGVTVAWFVHGLQTMGGH